MIGDCDYSCYDKYMIGNMMQHEKRVIVNGKTPGIKYSILSSLYNTVSNFFQIKPDDEDDGPTPMEPDEDYWVEQHHNEIIQKKEVNF